MASISSVVDTLAVTAVDLGLHDPTANGLLPQALTTGDHLSKAAVSDQYSARCSNTWRTHRSLTFGSIFFGMDCILPTHKDAAGNVGRFTFRTVRESSPTV